jgi:hypothetical protein
MRWVTEQQADREIASDENRYFTSLELMKRGEFREPTYDELREHYFRFNRLVWVYTVLPERSK